MDKVEHFGWAAGAKLVELLQAGYRALTPAHRRARSDKRLSRAENNDLSCR
jgi:hypothetical protein